MIFIDSDYDDWKPGDLIRSVDGCDLGIQLISSVDHESERVCWNENSEVKMSQCSNFKRIKPPDATTLNTNLGDLLAYAVLYCELHSKVCNPKITHSHKFTKYDCNELAKKILEVS